MDHDSRRICRKICLDVVLILIVGIPILVYFLFGKPYERGFFCDDESLKHPYHDSTVPSWTLYIYGLAFPIIVMILVEFAQRGKAKSIRIWKFEVPFWVWQCYCAVAVFGFGAACSQLSTDIMKYSVGRLRPHFFTVCLPNVDCGLDYYKHKYIENFTCTNDADGRKLKEMRLSFPSGHSSFSMYAMFYLSMYLQARWPWRTTLLLRNTIQYCCILLAIYTGMTRISDYKHHWSDVLAGLLLGIFVAVLVAKCASDLFSKKKSQFLLPIENSDTEMHPTRNGTSQP